MQSLVNGHLGREFLVLGDELGAHQLVGQGHRREQHQQRVNGGGVPKPGGAEEARNPDVVDQVGGADHAGADQHDHAAAEKSRPQCQDGGGSSLSGCILIHDLGVYDSGPILLHAPPPALCHCLIRRTGGPSSPTRLCRTQIA